VPDAIDVTVHGLPELFRGSRSLFGKIEKASDKTFADVADKRARIARGSVPRLTGALAGTVTAEGSEALFGGDLPYAGWVEFGGTRGRPYLPEGRSFFPATTFHVEDELEREATKTTQREVGKFSWPNVRK